MLNPSVSPFAARCVFFGLLIVALATGLVAGCSQPDPWQREDPAEAVRYFLSALAYQDQKTAWEFLNEEDRAALTARADALKALAPTIDRPPWQLLHPGHIAASPTELKAVEVTSRAEAFAEVRVSLHDGRAFTLSLLRVQDRWTIDLPIPAPVSKPLESSPPPSASPHSETPR